MKPAYRKSWAGERSDVLRFDLGPLLQGHTRTLKLKSAYNALIIGPRGLHKHTLLKSLVTPNEKLKVLQ